MKKADVKVGGHYAAKVTGRMATVRIDAVNPHGGWDATNLRTNKAVRIKSPQRLRHETRPPGRAVEAQVEAERAAAPDGMLASERAATRATARAKMGDALEVGRLAPGVTLRPRKAKPKAKPKARAKGGRGRKAEVAATVAAVEKGDLAQGVVIPTGRKPVTMSKADAVNAAMMAVAAAKKKRASGLDAAARVLGEEGRAMRPAEIVAVALERQYWQTAGKTPAATIDAAMRREIRAKGDQARFRLEAPGLFAGTGVSA